MRTSSLIHSCTWIFFFVSAVHTFDVTVGTPIECDKLEVSWIGGEPPFEILLIPVFSPLADIPVPSSAFSDGQGSYTIPQLPLEEGTKFLLSMSDATGFGSGEMTTLLTVGAPVANNTCDTRLSQDFYFNTPAVPTQCSEYFFEGYDGAVLPVTITVVIPGERFIILRSLSTSYTWIANVEAGTGLLFFMTDSDGRQGGVSNPQIVGNSTDSSCLAGNSPLPSASSPSQAPNQSTSPVSNTTTVDIIVGAAIGGMILLVSLTMLCICYKRGRQTTNAPSQVTDVAELSLVLRNWFASVTNSNKLSIQQAGTLFASFKAHSDKPPEHTNGAANGLSTGYARTCHMLHGMLVLIHIILVISSFFHWEHHMTLPLMSTNDDFWRAVLSVSLQGFYTIYTAILVFLTQRLAISKTLVRRLKLTSIHDISGAWSGLGSALSSIWQQKDIPASWWTTSSVAAYLACISMLHVTSSSILQLQTFNTTMSTSVSTALGWPDNQSNSSNVNWGPITASLPVVNQLPGLISAGISNNTVYDTPQTSPTLGTIVVNATMLTSHCTLLQNVTYSANSKSASATLDEQAVSIFLTPPWPGLIQVLPAPVLIPGKSISTLSEFSDTLRSSVFLVVSTSLDVNASVHQEASVPITWEYTNPAFMGISILYNISAYLVQCSFSATTAGALVDMQTNSLLSPVPMSQPSTQWEIYQSTPSSSNYSQLQLCQEALTSSWDSAHYFTDATGNTSTTSFVDEYIMGLVGIDFEAQYSKFYNGAPPTPSTFVLTPDKLESAIAHAAAQLMWIAGRIGSSNGGLDIGKGTADAELDVISLRLNINLFSLLFAASASVIMLGLALHMTRAFDTSHRTQAVIPNTGTLQLLWLGHHSAPVFEVLQDVEYPTDANLRRAGMIDVCFAKTTADEEDRLSTRCSTDSLSVQGDHS